MSACCPNCHRPHRGLVATAPMGPNGAGVKHCGCFWEGDAGDKDFHHSTTTAEQHAWMRGERSEDDVSEQSEGYVVRGTSASGAAARSPVYALLDVADAAAVDLRREGCTGVRVYRVDAEGNETPMLTYAELAARSRSL